MLNNESQDLDKQAAETNDGYFSLLPAISLPKGGGAIKGMGEKFAANPVTGTGSMSVPIATSPGRSGFEPQLSLDYDSGAGNGIFGLGWNLSFPSITRKTDKGLPRYWDSEESDVFILSGAEDLVPVLKTDGTVDETLRDGYRIRKYRPRIEGLFARIECWTAVDSGETHWRSISKDNITTLYGKTAESRIADPNEPTHIFSWLICESYDDKGNAILYEYKAENSQGVDIGQAHERNRIPEIRSSNRYLKRIKYGNRVSRLVQPDLTAADWMFEVVFDYGEHDLTNPKPNDAGEWSVRNDPFSSYRAGFEVRTYRLCQRVLMFHHFPDEAEIGQDCLVRSTDFTYSYESNPKDARNPIYSKIISVTQTGYKRNPEGGYIQKSLPPLEFTYSEASIDETVRDVDPSSLENLPQGIDGTRYQWVDLDGEGLSGILSEQVNGWFYKRNLSPVKIDGSKRIEARFAPLELVVSKPASNLSNGAQFLDLGGNGQLDLVSLRSPTPGFYERTHNEGWESFVAFKSLPNLDWDNPNLKFIDLDGDGHSDILITEDDCFVWHPSLAEDGFGAAQRVSQPWDEEKGPRIVFADSTQSIYLADMSGDGLTDIVRIRNGEVCYWANLGYGRFGAKVTMDNAPWFDTTEIFNQRRIVLADIDGSGTTDILYLSSEGVQVYFNQSGNGWSAKQLLRSLPMIDSVASVTVVDLLGNGTACLVWSSPLPGNTSRVMRYIDLMGGQKPHLLVKTVNNLGAETVVQYAPSTKFYIQDKLDGKPWITKIPFPVHVVEKVETHDRISGNRFVSSYTYHHGYFDGVEREFRGFGFVEQLDTEEYADFKEGGSTNALESAHIPPVHTKTWFHTGIYLDREHISNFFAQKEYYREPQYRIREDATEEERQIIAAQFQATLLPDTILPSGLTIEEEREACRALRGQVLRQEVYALDGSEDSQHPYSVTESNYEIRRLQPLEGERHAVFFVHPRESIAYHYERNPNDPRIGHEMTLEVDEFGNVLKSASIAYPRRKPQESREDKRLSEQKQILVTYTEVSVINKTSETDWYRLGLPVETLTYEITGLTPPQSQRYTRADFYRQEETGQLLGYCTAPKIDYEVIPNGMTPQKRLIEHNRVLYRPNRQANTLDPTPLALGEVESLALPYESYELSLTPGLVQQIFGSRVNDSLLENEGRYVKLDGNWWLPSGRQAFDPKQFYAPVQAQNPFGAISSMTYDEYALLITQTFDPLNNTVQVKNNYRILQPWHIQDPNGSVQEVKFDALGMVVATAVMGDREGDTLDNPTTTLEYDLFNWIQRQQPISVKTRAREQHRNPNTPWQESYTYSDGFGREIQTKAQAESGLAPLRDENTGELLRENGKLKLGQVNSRWVGTGRIIYNNKGKPVKQYEPFFSSTFEYETEQDLVEWGVTPIIHYDPLGRTIRTDLPNGTFSKVEFDTWQQITWDENDTVLDSEWYQEKSNLPRNNPEKRAAQLAAKHANTASTAYLDVLGRPVLTIADNGTEQYETHITLDIEGNSLAVRDARGNTVMEYAYEIRTPDEDEEGEEEESYRLYLKSMDAGERWTLYNVAGNPIREWDSRGFEVRQVYDALQRPTHLYVSQGTDPEILAEFTVYGESHPQATVLNLRGQVYQQFDGAGVVTNEKYDFKGNLRQGFRQLAKEYRQRSDWSILGNLTDIQQIATTAASLLESEKFTSSTAYDALNRPTHVTTPDNSEVQPTYNKANLLEKVTVNLRGATTATTFVENINYDAKGQRELIEYANGVKTTYSYDDKTFRLTQLLTTRTSDAAKLQDLNYTFDPVGNITEIRDDAQQTVYFDNAVVSPSSKYEYDALYRLIQAEGREHAGKNTVAAEYDPHDNDRRNLPHPNDGKAMRRYTQRYQYDSVGNILAMLHEVGGVTKWQRRYQYAKDNNRLLSTSATYSDTPEYSVRYEYDVHGNMTKMGKGHLQAMEWDFEDQLQSVDLGGGGKAYYVYDAGGERVRKVVEKNAGLIEERIYLGGFEIFRRRSSSGLKLERETLHIMDYEQRIALVETKTFEAKDNGLGGGIDKPKPVIRYQLGNHLGSASLELDDGGAVISYEEYYPYGSTSYQARRSAAEVGLKRYRYTGKERDEESGLYYHGARYYAAWLGRWISCDPIGIEDGVNIYAYVNNRPTLLHDLNGSKGKKKPTFWQRALNMGIGVLLIFGGAAEAAVGGAGIAAPEPGTTVLGSIVFAHGADTASTGLKMILSGGKSQKTLTEQAFGPTAEMSFSIFAPAKLSTKLATSIMSKVGQQEVGRKILKNPFSSKSKSRIAHSKKVGGRSHTPRSPDPNTPPIQRGRNAQVDPSDYSGPWVREAENVRRGGAIKQCLPGSCVSASGQMVSQGTVLESQLLAELGEWSNIGALRDALNKYARATVWQGGSFASGEQAVKVASSNLLAAELRVPFAAGHMVVIQPAGLNRFIVRDPFPGVTYFVNSDWIKKYVAGAVWRKK